MSLWFIVGGIVAVVVVIVVLAVVIVICCRKDRHHGRVFKQKNKPRSGGQGRLLEAGPEPSGKFRGWNIKWVVLFYKIN